jgi:hypothetical protein
MRHPTIIEKFLGTLKTGSARAAHSPPTDDAAVPAGARRRPGFES